MKSSKLLNSKNRIISIIAFSIILFAVALFSCQDFSTSDPPFAQAPMNPKFLKYLEDEEKNIKLYKAIFKKNLDVELFIETRGYKGLEMIKSGEPDLIILDNKVPELTGIEICKEIRKIDRFKEIPIIAASSSPINGNREDDDSFRVNFCDKKHHLNQCQDFYDVFACYDNKVTSYEDLIERLKDESA